MYNYWWFLEHTQYTGIIIIDSMHQILKVTKYTGILQNSISHPFLLHIIVSSKLLLNIFFNSMYSIPSV